MDSIVKLKQIVNSLDSGIGEENLQSLISLLSGLGEEVQDQGNVTNLVKMMQSTGRYLASKTHTAHPGTLPLLFKLADNLETLVSGQRSKAEEQELYANSIRSFKALKASIAGSSPVSDAELEELKAVILSIDWEISDSTLENLDRIIVRLKEKLKSNKPHHTFLRIMHSIGGYITRNKAYADKKSTHLLQSVFLNYEKMVQHPQMPLEEKKRMIENDIRSYNEFKREISSQLEPDPQVGLDDEDLPPALSHVDSALVGGGSATLSTLTEAADTAQKITPALAGKKKDDTPPRDVMGDLFSPKISPADELLDAIHLSELHGQDEPSPAGMMASDPGAEDGPGIKNFVPQRGGEVPIPEIESRLDEFFNLDVSENMGGIPEGSSEGTESVESVFSEDMDHEAEVSFEHKPDVPIQENGFEAEPAQAMEMVPDEGIELITPDHQEQSLLISDLKDDPAEPVLGRLKSILNLPSKLSEEIIFTQALEDLSQLEQFWDLDTDKTCLIDLLTGLVRHIHDFDSRPDQDQENMSKDTEVQMMDDSLQSEPILTREKDLAVEDASVSDDNSSEDEIFTDGNFDKGKPEDSGLEEDVGEEDHFEVEKAPKGFWGKIRSIFRN